MQMSPQQSASSRSFEIDQTVRRAGFGVDRDQQAHRFDDALGNGHVVVAAVVAWQASVATQPRDARRSRPRARARLCHRRSHGIVGITAVDAALTTRTSTLDCHSTIGQS